MRVGSDANFVAVALPIKHDSKGSTQTAREPTLAIMCARGHDEGSLLPRTIDRDHT